MPTDTPWEKQRPNIEIIQLLSSQKKEKKKKLITFFPQNSLSHWIWELDKIKFLGNIIFWGGQILRCWTVSGQHLYLLRYKTMQPTSTQASCVRFALNRAALGYFKVTISKWEQNCVIRFKKLDPFLVHQLPSQWQNMPLVATARFWKYTFLTI